MRSRYTLLLEAGGGTYVSQVLAQDAKSATDIWATKPDREVLDAFTIQSPARLHSAIKKKMLEPDSVVPITGLKNVWFTNFEINGIDGYLNIVLTAS